MNRRQGLATLADEVADVYADVGPATAQAWLVAVVDALAHALVDLADGREQLTHHTPVRALPLLRNRSDGQQETHVDRASCAAAAASVRHIQASARPLLTRPGGIPPGVAADTARAIDLLGAALEDLAGEPADSPRANAVRAGAMRAVRSAYRLVQPVGPPPQDPKPTSPAWEGSERQGQGWSAD